VVRKIDNFEIVKEFIPIQNYIEKQVKPNNLKYIKDEIEAACPVHHGTDRNFKTKDNNVHCFSQCGKSWDVIGLHGELNSLSPYDSMKNLAQIYGISINESNHKMPGKRIKSDKLDVEEITKQIMQDSEKDIDEVFIESYKLDDIKNDTYGRFSFDGKSLIAEVVVKKGKDEEIQIIPIYNGFLGITESVVDLDEDQGIEYLKIISYFHNIRKEILMRKAYITNENKMLETLNNTNGMIIKNRSKKLMIEYLEECYEGKLMENKLQSRYMTKAVGFYKYRKNGLVIDTFIYPNAKFSIDKKYSYNPNEMFNDVFVHAGTTEQWIKEVYNPVKNNTNAFISVIGAFASILIEPLGVSENFLIDISGSTSTGKSTLLKITSSIFGKPSKMVSDFNATSNSIISRAVALRNFPMFLDDSKKADKSIIGDVIYTLSGGKEKGRSTINGDAKAIREFSNITFINGEVAATEYLAESNSNGRGAYGRLLPLEGGFLPNSKENGELANTLLEAISKYYGAIGYEWIKFINQELNDTESLEQWREAYEEYKQVNSLRLDTDIARRRGVHIALLQTTYSMMKKFNFELATENEMQHFKVLIEGTKVNAESTDNYKLAHEHLMEKFKENSFKFNKPDEYVEAIEEGEIYKQREVWGDYKRGQYLVLSYETIAKLIHNFGDVKDILKKWRELGVLETEHNRMKKTVRVKQNGADIFQKRYVINERYSFEDYFEEVKDEIIPF